MKEFKYMFIAIVMFLVTIGSASAWIQEQHVVMNKEATTATQNNPLTQQIMEFEDYYHACDLLVDISVVGYFQIDTDADDGWWDKFIKAVQFKIGKTYRATHSQNSCLRAVSIAENPKELACAYGICSHHVQDEVSHELSVPEVIRKTYMWNGLIHSIKEIYDNELMTNHADTVYARNVLSLGYEMTPFYERVFKGTEDDSYYDPVLSEVDIPGLIDFFINQVAPNNDYQLGFRSFFALPQYVYWFILIVFLISVALVGFTIRRLLDKQIDLVTVFTLLFGILLLAFSVAVVYGLVSGNLWAMWQQLSLFFFGDAMYFVGGGMLLVAILIIFKFFMSKTKKQEIPNLLVALFLIMIGGLVFTLPNALYTGNEQRYHDLSVQQTENLLNEGASYIRQIGDPVGYVALKEAEEAGKVPRIIFLVVLIFILVTVMFFTFRRKKKKMV